MVHRRQMTPAEEYEALRRVILEHVPPPARRPRLRATFWWAANRLNRTRFKRAEIVLHDIGERLGGTR